jgi:Fe-S-cluster containining protein
MDRDEATPEDEDTRAQPDPVEELARQVERASLFTHACLDRVAGRASGIEGKLDELIELLRAKGTLDEELPSTPLDVPGLPVPPAEGEEPQEPAPVRWPSFALRASTPTPQPAVEVNCAERMHICHAVCCKLNFALTAEEVDAGQVRFDVGFPYMIRHDADGWCTHNDRSTGFCKVYADRPGICRHYSCANDDRIWSDFEKMELNHEWLEENLGDAPRIRLRLNLPLMDVSSPREATEPTSGAVGGAAQEGNEQ